MYSWNIFGARTNHGQIWTQKTHHVPYLWPSIENVIRGKMVAPITFEAYNFLCRPPIDVRSEKKLYPLLRAFQWYVVRHLHISKSE
jgi:hypothetical protein